MKIEITWKTNEGGNAVLIMGDSIIIPYIRRIINK